ncbi:SDR family oxidoreductase [Amycolatopsis sp. K13G38]|uniref:SDR family oxidoreductase n=1 Tax=Amycolatopsis acididurans TaxID=2724524 RepID=A0ABX1JE45_9PSEU|nr:SDR family oxidoreductase [Amycolatopsis acididurans]NKQ58050.1 SDR family oxidoreductase [Amycolatopsis acididurans]
MRRAGIVVIARTALVTGGSAGIGLATAARLLADGYAVVITGRDGGRLAAATESLGSPAALSCVVLDALDHDATVERVAELKPDVLVANVGTAFAGDLAHTSLDAWHRVLSTNVTSAFAALQACVPHMKERGWGRIVTVGSLASHRPIRFGVAYTASKHALWGLTRAVALDLRGTGVTANLVAPAFVRTGMTEANVATISAASSRSAAEVEQRLAGLSDLGRLLEPREVADEVAAFVADGSRSGEIRVMGDSARMSQ